MNALTVWAGRTTGAALTRTRSDRAAAEQRIADLENRRTAELGGDCDLQAIDLIDVSIAAERRTIVIAAERIAVLESQERRETAERRDARRNTAIATIERRLAKRTALAAELEAAVARVVEIYDQMTDIDAIKRAWPFPELLPAWFDFRFHDLSRQILYMWRRIGGRMLPDDVANKIGWAEAGDGVARAPGPRLPNDLRSVLDRNATHILDSLRKIKINPDDDNTAADTDLERVA